MFRQEEGAMETKTEGSNYQCTAGNARNDLPPSQGTLIVAL